MCVHLNSWGVERRMYEARGMYGVLPWGDGLHQDRHRVRRAVPPLQVRQLPPRRGEVDDEGRGQGGLHVEASGRKGQADAEAWAWPLKVTGLGAP